MTPNVASHPANFRKAMTYGTFALMLTSSCVAQTQQNVDRTTAPAVSTSLRADASLPDAPSFLKSADEPLAQTAGPAASQGYGPPSMARVAPPLASTIEPEYSSVPLTAGRSLLYAGHEVVSYQFPFRVVLSAGLSQARKTDPKYGDDSDAFAKRVGASAARQASQAIFSDGLLAPVLRQDPRYYVLGDQYSFTRRFFYAASRVFITRTDSGGQTLNTSTLLGYGGTAAMSQFYYPVGHRDIYAMSRTYGFSLLGLAGQHEAQEFFRFLVRGQPRP